MVNLIKFCGPLVPVLLSRIFLLKKKNKDKMKNKKDLETTYGEIYLKEHVNGLPKEHHFGYRTTKLPNLKKDGDILVKVLYQSVDPYTPKNTFPRIDRLLSDFVCFPSILNLFDRYIGVRNGDPAFNSDFNHFNSFGNRLTLCSLNPTTIQNSKQR